MNCEILPALTMDQTPRPKKTGSPTYNSVLDSSSSPTPVKLGGHEIEQNLHKRRRLNKSILSSIDDAAPLTIKAYLCEEELAYAAYPDTNALDGRSTRVFGRFSDGRRAEVDKADLATLSQNWPGAEIDAIMEQHGLFAFSTAWGWRKSDKPSFDPNKFYPTIITQVEPEPRTDQGFQWKVGGRKTLEIVAHSMHTCIRSHLNDQEFDFLVEVECLRQLTETYPYNIDVDKDADRKVVAKLMEAQEAVIVAARKYLPEMWYSIGVYSMHKPGTYPTEHVPTIAVSCWNELAVDFDAVVEELRKVVRSKTIVNGDGERHPPQIRLLQASMLTASSWTSRHVATSNAPKLGSSIAPLDAEFSGTLGGFVKLVKGGEEKLAVLTAGHVTFVPNEPGSVDYNLKGVVIGDPRPAIQIVSPSPRDIQATLQKLRDTKKSVANELVLLEARAADTSVSEARQEHTAKQLQHFQARLIETDKNISSLSRPTTEFTLGETLATCPITVKRNGKGAEDWLRMDWGLVELKGPRGTDAFGPNMTPELLEHEARSVTPFSGDTQVEWKNVSPVEEIGEPQFGTWACLSGRTSPWVAGEINLFRNKYSWTDTGDSKESWEWDVGHSLGLTRPDHFGQGGDSGSWVLNAKQELIGLYTGGNGFRGCITPIKEVFDDIYERTGGWTVELPQL